MEAAHILAVVRRLNSRRLAPAFLILTAVSGCSQLSLQSAEPVQFQQEEWTYRNSKGVKLTSDHYVIYTTCKAKPFTDAMPTFLEACWDTYAEILPPKRMPQEPLATYLFQSRWDWERFTEEFTGPRASIYKQIRSGGYSERGLTVSHYGSRRSTLSILAHEGLHQFLEVTHDKPIPAWINEGLACYFEAFELGQDNRPIFTHERNTLRRPALRTAYSHGKLQPLARILATDAGQEIHKPSAEVLTYYSQAWSLVVFLMRSDFDNEYRDGFTTLLNELGSEEMDRKARAFLAADTDGQMSRGEAIFRAYVTDDLEAFDLQYQAWLLGFLELNS